MKLLKQQVHANEVYKNGYTGKNVRIAVLDTGVFLHRDLRNRVFGFKDFVDGRGYCYDDNGHGTHVTGIICSNGTIKGIAAFYAKSIQRAGADRMLYCKTGNSGAGNQYDQSGQK